MLRNEDQKQTLDLPSRVLARSTFFIPWMVFLFVILRYVSWPIRNFVLVCWVYGRHAYFHDGIHVLPGKPVKFSDDTEAPTLPDIVTGFGAFIITVFGLTMLLIFALKFYERRAERKNRSSG